MSNVAWSDDRVTTLSKLWAQGLSAAQVASQLGGVTRNAVIGKVHRLGLAERGSASTPSRTTRISAPRAPRRPREVARAGGPQPSIPASFEQTLMADAPGLVGSLVHLGPHACKWPIGDPKSVAFSFCGTHADGRYCERHERLATAPTKRPCPIDRDPVVRRALAGLV